MDRLTQYPEIGREIFEQYTRDKVSHGDIRTEGVIDTTLDHYQVNHVGWDGHRRVHGVVLHFDIIDNKFWAQYDGTDRSVVEELEAAGVPKDNIVLAFHSPETRKLTGYAVG